MFDMNRRYKESIVAPIVPLIIDQTSTLQCIIPMGDLSKYNRRNHAWPSGYGLLGSFRRFCLVMLGFLMCFIYTIRLYKARFQLD